MELARLYLQHFLSHKTFADCFTEKKNRQHFHHPTAYYYSRESKSSWYAISHRSLNAGARNARRPENDEFSLVDICQQEIEICKHFREKRLTCRIPAPCRSIPTALAPFSVAIRRMIMQHVVCFSFKANNL